MQQAIALHNRGQLDDADAIYRNVLQHAPRHPDALHLRALVAHSQGRFAEAAGLAEAAIGAAPRVANLQNTAGEAWRRHGHLEKAIPRLSEAIRLDPRMAMAHHNLSLALYQAKRYAAALTAHQRALELNPAYVEAIAHGIEIACALDDEALASRLLLQIEQSTGNPLVASSRHRYQTCRARRLLRQLDPAAADEATALAIAASPDSGLGWALRSEAKFDQGDLEAAEHCATVAANLAPQNRDARLNLAIIIGRQKRHREAAAHLTAWLADHPDDADAKFSLAGNQLSQGDYLAVWDHYESRWESSAHHGTRAPFPQWQGGPVKKLLIYAEQGLGDSVQMMRFLPEVQRRCGGKVILQMPGPLLRLAQRIFGNNDLGVTSNTGTQAFDAACPLMSLPRVLQLGTADRFLGQAAFLSSDANRTEAFKAFLARHPGKKIGIVWRGNALSKANRLRTMEESALVPIMGLPGWTAVSLQFGVKAPEIASRPLLDLSGEISDFDDLAAAIKAVDVVVSLDTGPAHLAGALGVPTFTLLPWLHDWRWGAEGSESPWYSTMTLLRQARSGSWQAAISQLTEHLGRSGR